MKLNITPTVNAQQQEAVKQAVARAVALDFGPEFTVQKVDEVHTSALPVIGASHEDGIYAGITTKPDGTPCIAIKLPGMATKVTWQQAMDWAKAQGGELPTRPVAALLFANIKKELEPSWHWLVDEHSASYAWQCHFFHGFQGYDRKRFQGSAVAVRLIPLTL